MIPEQKNISQNNGIKRQPADPAGRILIFCLTYLPFIGGAEVAVKEIANKLANEFEFDLITARLDKKIPKFEKINNVNVFRVNWGNIFDKYLYPWLALRKAKQLLGRESTHWIPACLTARQARVYSTLQCGTGMANEKTKITERKVQKYNIVWGIMASWGGWAALKFKEKFPQVKYLLTLQSGDSDAFIKRRTWWWQWRYKQIYQKADRIQVISKWLAKRARRYGYQGEINLVPNGVAMPTINNQQLTTNRKEEIKSELEIKSDEKIILTVSRLVKKNDTENLIRAFKLLVTSYKLQITLLIVGDGPLKNKLQNLVRKLDIEDKVIFIDSVPHEELPSYYTLADVFARPSLSEGFGNVFVEAMASGVPVIATPVGGIPDFLKDKETGLFCQVNNPKDLAEKIKILLDDEGLRNKIIRNARKMVEERYDWDIIVEKMRMIFSSLHQGHL